MVIVKRLYQFVNSFNSLLPRLSVNTHVRYFSLQMSDDPFFDRTNPEAGSGYNRLEATGWLADGALSGNLVKKLCRDFARTSEREAHF